MTYVIAGMGLLGYFGSMRGGKGLRLIYTFFLGVLLALFVGVGVNTFYVPPAAPKYPIELNTYGKELTPEQILEQQALDKQNEQYQERMKPYNRNTSMLTLGIATTLLIAGMAFQNRLKLVADGVMLGGLFTLLYSIGRGFASESSKYTFIVVTIGLILTLYLGYRRFIQSHTP